MARKKSRNMKANILAIAIAVVFLLFIMLGINTFMEEPEFDCECNRTTNKTPEKPICGEEYQECTEDAEDARNSYKLKVFIIMVVIGIAAITGSFFIGVDAVSTGIMGGGLLTIFVGAIQNWGNFQDWMKFIILGVVLFILVWLGYKKLK